MHSLAIVQSRWTKNSQVCILYSVPIFQRGMIEKIAWRQASQLAEFILEDGFPSKTGNSCDGFIIIIILIFI
jgi:hypothetical protein